MISAELGFKDDKAMQKYFEKQGVGIAIETQNLAGMLSELDDPKNSLLQSLMNNRVDIVLEISSE